MKRIVSILMSIIVIVMFSLVSALAEDFTLHSGVTFGMNIDNVLNAEKNAGFECEEKEANSKSNKAEKMLVVSGKVAGIENSDIQYSFDTENKVYAATYILGNMLNNDGSDYEIIENSLKEKYGEPEDMWLPIVNRIGYEPINYLWGWVGVQDELPENSSWALQQQNGDYVVICHYQAKVDMFGRPALFHVVGYQQFLEDELSQEINNISNEAEENQGQLSNDL